MLEMLDIYDRCLNGQQMEEKKFDKKLFKELATTVKNYDITYNSEEVIPTDLSMIKDIFEGAVDVLVELGFYNTSTESIIKFDESEIRSHLKKLPTEITIGEGNDALTYGWRDFKDKTVPPTIGGPCGGPITEEYYIPAMQSFAMEPCVKGIHNGTLLMSRGNIKSKTPADMLNARLEATMTREAMRRAGRPGLSMIGTMSSTTSEGQCFAHCSEGLRPTDRLLVALLNEFKIDWDVLNKAVYCQQNNIGIDNCMVANMGGFMGGPETTVVGLTAECIASFLLLGGPVINIGTLFEVNTGHTIFGPGTFSFAGSIAALTQNTKALVKGYPGASSGMGTEKCNYEIVAMTGAAVAAGADGLIGAPTSDAIDTDVYGGFNARIQGEAANVFAGKSLEEANSIVVELMKKYGGNDQSTYKATPGKKFYECYNLKTLQPSKELVDSWEKTKVDIRDMGLNLE
jgi:methylamine--corrinoid protein Co-methyltransferase